MRLTMFGFYVLCTHDWLSELLSYVIKQAGINIHTIPNMWGAPGFEPVTTGSASVYLASALPPVQNSI